MIFNHENPASRRHQLSRPLRIVSPIHNKIQIFSLYFWGRAGLVVAMFIVYPFHFNLFLGLSLALRSHDHFQASHWSTHPPPSQLPRLFSSSFLPPSHGFFYPRKKEERIESLSNFFFFIFLLPFPRNGLEIQCLLYARFFYNQNM